MLKTLAISTTGDRRDDFDACLQRLQDLHSTSGVALSAPQSTPASYRDWPPLVRPTAPFLMHLIATAQFAPQTCKRRRADPDQAVATYAAIMRKPASTPAGRRFSRCR